MRKDMDYGDSKFYLLSRQCDLSKVHLSNLVRPLKYTNRLGFSHIKQDTHIQYQMNPLCRYTIGKVVYIIENPQYI